MRNASAHGWKDQPLPRQTETVLSDDSWGGGGARASLVHLLLSAAQIHFSRFEKGRKTRSREASPTLAVSFYKYSAQGGEYSERFAGCHQTKLGRRAREKAVTHKGMPKGIGFWALMSWAFSKMFHACQGEAGSVKMC